MKSQFQSLSKLAAVALVVLAIALQSCGLGQTEASNELVGVMDREGWYQTLPFGMVVVPSGTFHMGQTDEDVPHSHMNFNKQVTVGGFYMDQTEITNNEYRQFVTEMQGDASQYLDGDDPQAELLNDAEEEDYYPDTTVWASDYSHHLGDPMLEYYYMHPAFDDYPVVGVDWQAAQLFCAWRTKYYNAPRQAAGEPLMPNFRLPSEAEWEYAARGGRDLNPFPWGGPYIRNTRGCMLANFKPGRGNYYDDGFSYTAPVGAYFANDYGLYDMSGNVAEWCEDAYKQSGYQISWDLNPTYFKNNESRKIIRGGSWKDIKYYLRTGTRDFEYEDSAKSYVGFRCVVTYLGRSSGSEF